MLTVEDLLSGIEVQEIIEIRKWSDEINDFSIRKRFDVVGSGTIPQKLLKQYIKYMYTVDNIIVLELSMEQRLWR